MTKNSMAALSEKLQQQLKDDQLAVSSQTSELLKQHASGLKKLSTDALNTTKNAIQLQSQALDDLHSETLSRLKWLMLWPLLSSICLSLVILASATAWSWWTVRQVDDQVQQKQQQIRQIESTFCATPAGLSVCKKKEQ